MAFVTVGRVIVVSGILFGAGYAIHRYQKSQAERRSRSAWEQEARRRQLEECLSGVWSEPRELIPDVVGDLWGPSDSAAYTGSGRRISVHLTPQAQRNAWAAARHMAIEGRTKDRDAALRMILQHHVAPGCDWSEGFLPYQHDARFREVHDSTGRLLDIAELSAKYAPVEGGSAKGSLICPGWVHEAPAPTAGVQPGDFLEVLVDELSTDPKHQGRGEWAWVRVDAVEGDDLRGTITKAAPPGAPPNELRRSETHGFRAGDSVGVPAHCVFRVVQAR